MIVKEYRFCREKDAPVEALIERAAAKSRSRKVLAAVVQCLQSASCPRTTFCRFVNPLTVRVPLDDIPSVSGTSATPSVARSAASLP